MYAFFAVLMVASFAVMTVGLPLRFETIFARLLPRFRHAVLCGANQAMFQADSGRARYTLQGLRVWFFLSAVVFTGLGIYDGTVISNRPASLAAIVGYGALAFTVSSVVILAIVGYFWVVPGFRGYATLTRCGFRGLWVLPAQKVPQNLAQDLREQAAASRRLAVVDYSGYEMLVQGPDNATGVLREILTERPNMPVDVLLLNPMTQEMDPDRRKMTVYQSVLAELGMTPTVFMKRLQRALAAIDALNRERPKSARITVRYYNEKPTMRALIFEESMLVFPCGAREVGGDLPCLELSRSSDAPSFYETFRRDYSRRWRGAIAQVLPANADAG